MNCHKPRVLFMAEGVTLAHVARPVALARTLPTDEFDTAVAVDARYDGLLRSESFTHLTLHSLDSEVFLGRLRRGSPVMDFATLRSQVEEDLRILARFKPDLVVGDMRLSLSVSARVANVPYANVTNGYWSVESELPLPVPDLPMTRWLGVGAAQAIFRGCWPVASAVHGLAMRRLRREHRMPPLGWDVRWAYLDGDFTLLTDVPGLVPMRRLPERYMEIGPVLWSPPGSKPVWWNRVPTDQPIAYVTLGSSGRSDLLAMVVGALRSEGLTVLASTAGRVEASSGQGVFTADYLPGVEAARRASVVVCNGGSLGTQQALAAGTPLLGLASNMDQLLNMACVERAGAGLTLRGAWTDPAAVRRALRRLLDDPSFRRSATELSQRFPSPHDRPIFPRCARQIIEQAAANADARKQDDWQSPLPHRAA